MLPGVEMQADSRIMLFGLLLFLLFIVLLVPGGKQQLKLRGENSKSLALYPTLPSPSLFHSLSLFLSLFLPLSPTHTHTEFQLGHANLTVSSW